MVWQKKPLTELCELFADGDWIETKDQSSSGVRLVQTGNVGIGEFKDRADKARFISEDTFSRLRCTEIFPGDCLVSRLPDPVGRTCVLPETGSKMITAVDCTIIRFKSTAIAPNFFNYYSQSKDYLRDVDAKTSGATRKRISRKKLGEILIPVPPLPEQKQIVAILDEAFANIDHARQLAERNLNNARELFNSTLNRIFTQRGENWITENLKNLTTKIGSGATPRGGKDSYKDMGIPLIRSLNVHDRVFRRKDLAFLDDAQATKLDNVIVQSGDVLLNITGASVARCCVAPDEYLPARVNQHVSIIRPKPEQLLSEFLNYLLTSKHYKDQLLGIGEVGSTRQAITKAQIESFELSYPSELSEQQSIAGKVRQLQQQTEKLELLYQQKITALDELKQSLLQKAFRGELTQEQVAA